MAVFATDNFTRADNASLGSPWNPNTGDSDAGGFKIASNTAQPDNVTQDSSEGNSAVTYPTDYYVEVTYGTTNADGVGAGSGPSAYQSITAKTMYRAVGNASGYELFRFNAGVGTSLSSGSGTTFALGDKLRLEIRVNGANRDWVLKKNGVQFASGTDTSPLTTSAQAGIAHSSTSTTGAITFWETGDFTSASDGRAIGSNAFHPGRSPGKAPLSARFWTPPWNGGSTLRAITLTADVGTYNITGPTANLLRGAVVLAAQGAYSITGPTVNLLKGFDLIAAGGSYSISGKPVNLLKGSILPSTQGAYAISGKTVNLLVGRVVQAASGSYAISGSAAGSVRTYVLAAASGVYNYSGKDANLVWSGAGVTPGGSMAAWLRRRRR